MTRPTEDSFEPSDAGIRAQLLDELAKWSTFPVADDPRPMVLLSDAFAVAGFYDDTKVRFRRAVEVDPSVPPQIAASRAGIRTPGEASIAADGITVAFRFAGRPAEYGSYPRTLVEESDHAVAVYPIAQDHPHVTGSRLHYAQHRTVDVTLARPLGGRVLLGFGRGPVSVTPSVASV